MTALCESDEFVGGLLSKKCFEQSKHKNCILCGKQLDETVQNDTYST